MMNGMLVVYGDEIMTVARMSQAHAAYAGGPSHETITLAHRGGVPAPLVHLDDPRPGTFTLLPRCTVCGMDAEPGQPGSTGWPCSPGCPSGEEARLW